MSQASVEIIQRHEPIGSTAAGFTSEQDNQNRPHLESQQTFMPSIMVTKKIN